MERIVLAILDGRRCIDKIKIKKSDIDKRFIDSNTDDFMICVSPNVVKFLRKHA